MKYGLVLAGGGTRGAFQVGVWKAVREMGLEIDAIAGTSIGAVNGAMFAMGIDPEEMWLNTGLTDIVELEGGDKNLFSLKSLTAIAAQGLKGGLDTAPFRRLLTQLVDEDVLRSSPVDYGLCTYCITEKKSVELFKDDIPEGKLVDYILASACFPVFKPIEIDGRTYSDGGLQNNLPENMLINRGCNTIISVSVKGIGFIRAVDSCGINIIDIDAPEAEVGLMDFSRDDIERSIRQGYLETQRVFGRCCGRIYAVDKMSYYEFIGKYGPDLFDGIETAAKLCGIDACRIYRAEELAEYILREYGRNKKLRYMTELMEKSRYEFLRENLGILGDIYSAASSILYLKRCFNTKKQ